MSSTILYKFRSSTTFEALPLPGTSARLFDVKKAIVKAKRLDVGGMDFELEVHDATTDQQYVDESMLLPRGTRLIVGRVGAARGQGIVARIQRAESGMITSAVQRPAVPSGYYTIESNRRDDEDDFVPTNSGGRDDENELAALMAATEASQNPMAAARSMAQNSHRPAGGGPPPSMGGRPGNMQKQAAFRPNADPELRAQEQQQMPKKRATGIPRTFLNLSAPPVTDGTKAGEDGTENVPRLQPNALGFEELVNRGGGQSENTAGTKRDLDYALKLTATTIPEHLQCAICNGVVKNAMLLPWDPEGRTTCETCIRDALAQSGFVCPLTGIEGVSPDDLLPNQPLRKAADLFIKGVMEKMDEIDKQQIDEPEQEVPDGADSKTLFEGDSGDKGVIVSKKTMKDLKSKRASEDDPFSGGDDDFGGDVFDVEADDEKEEESKDVDNSKAATAVEPKEGKSGNSEVKNTSTNSANGDASSEGRDKEETDTPLRNDEEEENRKPHEGLLADKHVSRRETKKTRGPPAGYAMGPAGGAAVRGPGGYGGPRDRGHDDHYSGGRGGYGGRWGRPYRGRGRSDRGRYYGGGRYGDHRGGRGAYHRGGRYEDDLEEDRSRETNGDEGRGTKRHRSDSDDGGGGGEERYHRRDRDDGDGRERSGRDSRNYRSDRYDDRWDSHGYRGRGRGYRGRSGYGRGRY